MKPVNKHIVLEDNHYKTIVIPEELVDIIKEKLGDEFIWDYDKKTNRLFLLKKPESYTDFLSGLGKEMWESVGGTDYIRQERDKEEGAEVFVTNDIRLKNMTEINCIIISEYSEI